MEQRTLGSQGPQISTVGFGAAEAGGDIFGPNESNRQVIDAIRTAIDEGMNWIDTAEIYGAGRSEELVGQALIGRREEMLIFTKVAPREDDSSATGFRPEEIQRAIRGSLTRLRVQHVDLYQLHWPDSEVPLEETWGAMASLVADGLVRYTVFRTSSRMR